MDSRENPVFGRDAELAAIDEFLHGIQDGFAALILQGEAGIGKTAVWLEGVNSARDLGVRVLSTRPAQAEATFSFAALGDLAEDVLEEILPELPQPQRKALEVALLRAPARKRPSDHRVVAVGVLSMIRALARSGPVVLAIDDLQWLDAASSAVLAFALRRLEVEPVLLLATRRFPENEEPDAAAALPANRVHRRSLAPLTVAALHRAIESHLGLSAARPLLLRIHEASDGNPFFALEMARHLLQDGPTGLPLEDLPVPESLGGMVRGRLAALSQRDRQVLVHVTAMARPTRASVEEALPLRLHAESTLRRARDAGVIVLDGERLRFSHPLLGSVLYADASPVERRRTHRRLAAVVTDPEERARHLALAADTPEASIASALDRAAEQAGSRGATEAAAWLSRHALRLTPASNIADQWQRTMQTADYLFQAGAADAAQMMLEQLTASMPRGPGRAEVLWRLGRFRREGLDTSSECTDLFREALVEVDGDLRLRALILNALAWAESHEDLEASARHARESVVAAEEAGDLGVLADSLASVGFFACLRGSPEEEAAFERAVALEPHVVGLYVEERPSWVRAVSLMVHDRFDEAREQIRAFIQEALERGEMNALPTLRLHLSELESWAGNWHEAEQQAAQGYDEAGQMEQPVAAARLMYARGLTHALQGRLELARQELEETLQRMEHLAQPTTTYAVCALGFVALSEGEPARAVATLAPLAADLRRVGVREPGSHRFAADLAEAHVPCGDIDAAETVIVELEERGRVLDRAYARATGARCRGLALAARGNLEGALASLRAALVEHERLPQPFELGRTLVALGQVQRRMKAKRSARETLERAVGIFQGLGASVWAERARAELSRIGGRSRGDSSLTPTEARVAELAAEGSTNQEIAGRLFLSTKTVEANLSRVYRKIGVRSRTELSRALSEGHVPSRD